MLHSQGDHAHPHPLQTTLTHFQMRWHEHQEDIHKCQNDSVIKNAVYTLKEHAPTDRISLDKCQIVPIDARRNLKVLSLWLQLESPQPLRPQGHKFPNILHLFYWMINELGIPQ